MNSIPVALSLTIHVNNTLPFEVNILSDEEIQSLQDKYTRKIKTEMKQKWSYQSLLKSLASNQPEYKAQLGTIATYSLSSHFCHYDWIGVSSRLAQLESAYDEKDEIYDILHCYRILSNILSFEMFRASEYVRVNNFSSAHTLATVYKGNIIKNLIMDCQSYTKYRPNETTGGIFVSWRRKEELPTGA